MSDNQWTPFREKEPPVNRLVLICSKDTTPYVAYKSKIQRGNRFLTVYLEPEYRGPSEMHADYMKTMGYVWMYLPETPTEFPE